MQQDAGGAHKSICMHDLERLLISRRVNGWRRYYMIASIIWLAAMALFAAIILIAHSDISKLRAVTKTFYILVHSINCVI